MSECQMVTVWINGSPFTVPLGSVVSAAMLSVGAACRISVSGEPRTALCGMGICLECRAVVDGVSHQRTCQLLCREGMRVETQS
jgi:sarcosine oxidase subunit alpha